MIHPVLNLVFIILKETGLATHSLHIPFFYFSCKYGLVLGLFTVTCLLGKYINFKHTTLLRCVIPVVCLNYRKGQISVKKHNYNMAKMMVV